MGGAALFDDLLQVIEEACALLSFPIIVSLVDGYDEPRLRPLEHLYQRFRVSSHLCTGFLRVEFEQMGNGFRFISVEIDAVCRFYRGVQFFMRGKKARVKKLVSGFI